MIIHCFHYLSYLWPGNTTFPSQLRRWLFTAFSDTK